jgi:hypothetical protein
VRTPKINNLAIGNENGVNSATDLLFQANRKKSAPLARQDYLPSLPKTDENPRHSRMLHAMHLYQQNQKDEQKQLQAIAKQQIKVSF